MKKSIMALSIATLSILASAFVLPTIGKAAFAVAKWAKTEHDFGKIKQAEPVQATFYFTNNGEQPLIISSVKTSCGCTASDFSKEAIMPGKKGFVKATYNATSTGAFSKTVTVFANTEESMVVLTVKGEVI